MTMAFASKWTPAAPTPTTDNIGWDGYTYSEWLTGSVISTPGAVMRLKMKAGSVGHNIVKMYVGSALAASPLTFTGDQVQVKFNGNAGLTVGANEDMVTDAFTTPDISGTRKLLIRVYSTGASNTSYLESGGAGGDAGNVGRCWNLADTAASTTIATTSGASPHNIIWTVETAAVIPSKSCQADSNWRVVFDNVGLVNPTRIKYSEINLIGTHLEEKIATTTSGNGFVDSTTAAQANDGNTAQSVHMGYGPETSGVTYVRFDFSSMTTIAGVQIVSSNDTDGSAVSKAPVDFRLQRLNGDTWVTYIQVKGAVWDKLRQAITFYADGSHDGGGSATSIGPIALATPFYPCPDTFLGPLTWAAGFRRLVGTYGGPLLRLRNPADNSEFDVLQTTDGRLEYVDTDAYYFIVGFYDQTGQGSDIWQTTTTKQPLLYLHKTATGGPAAWFDGSDDRLADINGFSSTAPYMTPKPNMFVISGAGVDGTQQTNFRPVMVIEPVNTTAYPYGHPLSVQWYGDVGDNQVYVSVWGTNQGSISHLPITGYLGWYGFALVPSLAKAWFAGTASGSETALASLPANATYGSETLTVMGDTYSPSVVGRKGYFVEGYIADDLSALTLSAVNTWFRDTYEALMLPNTVYRFTTHGTFEIPTPSAVYTLAVAEIEIAATAGSVNEAQNSIVALGAGVTATNDTNGWFDGVLHQSIASLQANHSVGEMAFTFRPTLYETNDAKELRVTTVYTSILTPVKMARTFKLERSTDKGVTYSSLGEYDASIQHNPPTDQYTYTFVIGEVHTDFTFDYKLNFFGVDFTFDYKIALGKSFAFDYKIALGKSFAFDYKIALSKDIALDYKIALGKSFTFDYKIDARVNADFTFDYHLSSHIDIDVTFDFKILEPFNADFVFDYKIFNINTATDFVFDYLFTPTAHADFTFDYALSTIVGIRADFTFDYQLLPTFSLVGLPGLRMPPETPVGEIIGYVTNVISAYDGTEQRASLAQFAYANVTFKYVILNDSDRRAFMADFMAVSRGVCLVPQWQYGTNIAAAAEAAESVSYDPTTTDIRSGDYLYYLTPQGLTGFFGQALNVNPTGAVVAPLLTALPNGSWIMPARKMHWSDGQGVQMQSIAGEASVAMSGLGLRSPMREGQVAGLVPTFDGLPLLDKRPLAPADDLFTGGDLVLALSADLPTEIFSPARMSVVSGSRAFTAGRGQGLDFWREFANATAGAKKPFLAPSFRADLVPVSVSGDLLRVAGEDYLPLAGLPAYSRLAIETASGVTNYKIIGAEALDGDTIIQTSVAITGTIKKISYLNQFRLLNDTINLTHDVMNVKVGFAVRTTNE